LETISLLNVDYKNLSRIFSNRLKNVLPSIISIDQTSCVIGRDISDTVASVRDLIEMVENDNTEGYLVKIDQEKAFDRMSHKYVSKVLEKFGFGRKFCKWMGIFYTEIFSAIKCNGFLSNYFPIKNSVRQGCPISAMLFVLTAEPLNRAIKTHRGIKGILIPNSDISSTIFQHADDTTATVSDKMSIANIFEVFELYGKASGAKVNESKSQIMCLGKANLSRDELGGLEIMICKDVLEILGIYVGKNRRECEEKNWRNKVNKIKNILNMWKQRSLNIQGRVTIISSLLVSRLWYAAMVINVPTWVIDEIKLSCLRFVWMKKSYPVKYTTLIGDKTIGGLNFPDIEMKIKAFRMKFIAKFLNPDCKAIWKDIFIYFLNYYLRMNLKHEYLFLSLNKKTLNKLPIIYKEMLIAWDEFKENIEINYDIETVFRQPLFFNSRICYRKSVLYFECFVKSGITQIKDLTYEVIPKLLPFAAVKEIVLENCPDVEEKVIERAYSVICNSIPIEWYIKVQRNVFLCTIDYLPQFILVHNANPLPINYCSTSLYYRILRKAATQEPTSTKLWKIHFTEFVLHKQAGMIHVHMNSKCPDMIELDFKIFHNIIYTNKKLKKMGIVNSELCGFCNKEIEDLLHIFIGCPRLKSFRDFLIHHLENMFTYAPNSYICNLNINFILMFGYPQKIKNVNYHLVNFFLSQARMCIYKTRGFFSYKGRTVNLISFFKYSFEKNITYIYQYYNVSKRYIFTKYFIQINNLIEIRNENLHFNW